MMIAETDAVFAVFACAYASAIKKKLQLNIGEDKVLFLSPGDDKFRGLLVQRHTSHRGRSMLPRWRRKSKLYSGLRTCKRVFLLFGLRSSMTYLMSVFLPQFQLC